jgi:DNA invertase Pin-like site-specific DNA recombinase
MPAHQGQFPSLPAPTLQRLFRLVDQGLSYTAVANQLGCHRGTVYNRIRKRSGKAPRNSHVRISEADRRRIRQLLQNGESKSAIARQIGCARATVARYASQVEIPRHHSPVYAERPGCRGYLPATVKELALELLAQGKSYRQTALVAGCSRQTVSSLARSHGVGQRSPVRDGIPPTARKQIRKLIASGCTYLEVARQMGCHENTVIKHAQGIAGPRRRVLRDDEKALIDHRAADGATYVAIAQELGLHWKTVARHASNQVGADAPVVRRRNLTRSQVTQILEMSDAGESASAIATAIGCSPSTVWYQQRLRLAEKERAREQVGRAGLIAGWCPDCRAVCSLPCKTCRSRRSKQQGGYAR